MVLGERIDNVRKIAVLRANALGDYTFILPALEALRAAYPGAEIVLLGRQWHVDFITGRPGPVDRAIAVPPSTGVNAPPGVEIDEKQCSLGPFFESMACECFDLAVQLHGGGRYSNPFLRRLGARVTAGLRTPDAVQLDRWLPCVYYQPEIVRYLEVAALVGAAPVTLEPRVCLTAQDVAEAADFLPPSDRPLIALHPGVGDGRRRWPAEKFAAVGDALAAQGARILVTGTAPERALVDAVRARFRPVTAWQLDCPVCGQDCTRVECGHHESFVSGVRVDDVLAAAADLLQG